MYFVWLALMVFVIPAMLVKLQEVDWSTGHEHVERWEGRLTLVLLMAGSSGAFLYVVGMALNVPFVPIFR